MVRKDTNKLRVVDEFKPNMQFAQQLVRKYEVDCSGLEF